MNNVSNKQPVFKIKNEDIKFNAHIKKFWEDVNKRA